MYSNRMIKTINDAKMAAFTCQLIYFTVKGMVVLVLLKYDNYLIHNMNLLPLFIILLLCNSFLFFFTGIDAGFESINSTVSDNSLLLQHGCQICGCNYRNRMKHCYRCGRCVMKYDHHCPWIDCCVGEYNQRKFWLFLFLHTIQSIFTLKISWALYSYKNEDASYNGEYGAFCILTLIMVLYFIFAGSLLIFHTFLIVTNITTNQLIKANHLPYLKGVRGNPFSQGFLKNIEMVLFPIEGGRLWQIKQQQQRQRTCLEIIWSNDYYNCC